MIDKYLKMCKLFECYFQLSGYVHNADKKQRKMRCTLTLSVCD